MKTHTSRESLLEELGNKAIVVTTRNVVHLLSIEKEEEPTLAPFEMALPRSGLQWHSNMSAMFALIMPYRSSVMDL